MLIFRRQCDERRPLCRNCERHFSNIEKCDFDIPSPTTSAVRIGEPSSSENPLIGTGNLNVTVSRSQSAENLQLSLPTAVAAGMLDPFEAHPPTQAPGVDRLMNHCRCFAEPDSAYELTLAKPILITDRPMVYRSLNVCISILPLLRYQPHDRALVAVCPNR